MIIPIKFQLEDIVNGANDSYELHLFFNNNEHREIAMSEIHDQDFTFKLISQWTVSAFFTQGFDVFYIRACMDNALHSGKYKYYNQSNKTSYYKAEFNNELRQLYTGIENTTYEGEFNTETRVMTINN